MKFSDVVEQARTLLQRAGKITYRTLKREFDLDEEALADLKDELLFSDPQVKEESERGLVWIGDREKGEMAKGGNGNPEGEKGKWGNGEKEGVPGQWTPPHLAERIRAVSVAEGERKTITALFADLKGSTALIEGLDPEEARAIIDPALQLMMDAVHRYEGYVAQALGDGIFALFGAPIAHEDHPQRALYAALRMQEEMRRYSDHVRLNGGPPLQLRVGINTGEVVVRSIHKDDLRTDYVPVGHSTNLAARMEQMATPGSILITEDTRKLTEGYFEFKALGAAQIKGVEGSLPVYEVLGAGPLRTRLQVSATRRGLTRFVGRQSEMEQLTKALEQAKAGHGQIVGVMGEPGLGKSRLFHEFKLLSQVGCLILEAYSVSHGKATAYLPVIELVKSYFRIEPQDDERTRREKVGGKVLMLDRSLEDTLPYLFTLLGIEEHPSPLQQMDAQIRRQRTFAALKKLFLRESLNQPLILIFEDLHWIDEETQGFLDVLSESVASARLLLLVNYRPEYRHEWGQKSYYTQLRLAPFGKVEAEEFLTSLLGNDPNLTALKQLILDKTEGTPFFMEEIVQELMEQGVLVHDSAGVGFKRASIPSSLPDLHLPPTVQGVLAARIDRLVPDEKALLQQLAVIGREFPLSLLRQVIAHPDEDLYRLLSSLQHKEFLYEQPAFPDVEYSFKHALTQEVAYGSVLHERRKALHEQTAQAMETLYHDRLEEYYSELAHHYSRSGNTETAVKYLHLAGQQAVQRSANAEAVTHFTTALEFLQTLADTSERVQQELTLQLALAAPLSVTKGLAAPEVGAVRTRALELCRQVGETPQLFAALWGARSFYLMRAEFQTARDLAERLVLLAQQAQDPTLLLEAHTGLGSVLLSLGELGSARIHFEHALALYDPRQRRASIARYGGDIGSSSVPALAQVLWLLGYPDQARKRSHEALTLAQEIAHPFSTAVVWMMNTWVYQFLHAARAVQREAEALVTLSHEQGLSTLHVGTILHGWALAEQGQVKEGIKEIQQGLAAHRAGGTERSRPYYLALLAEAYGKAEQEEEGLTVLSEALEAVERTGERMYEAELYRLKGELTLARSKVQSLKPVLPAPVPQAQVSVVEGSQVADPQGEAEACFHQAIDIARRQQAKSWELRATVSLARLWQQQGKTKEAHGMLCAVYNWFTEGFDTKDLQEAQALLEELR